MARKCCSTRSCCLCMRCSFLSPTHKQSHDRNHGCALPRFPSWSPYMVPSNPLLSPSPPPHRSDPVATTCVVDLFHPSTNSSHIIMHRSQCATRNMETRTRSLISPFHHVTPHLNHRNKRTGPLFPEILTTHVRPAQHTQCQNQTRRYLRPIHHDSTQPTPTIWQRWVPSIHTLIRFPPYLPSKSHPLDADATSQQVPACWRLWTINDRQWHTAPSHQHAPTRQCLRPGRIAWHHYQILHRPIRHNIPSIMPIQYGVEATKYRLPSQKHSEYGQWIHHNGLRRNIA